MSTQSLDTLRAVSLALRQGAASLEFMGQHVDRTIEEITSKRAAAERDRAALTAHWAPVNRYFDAFDDYEDMVSQWSGSKDVADAEVIFAIYDCPPYEGYAICLYKRDGKLFEVNDSYCSCYGLENWVPEETSVDAVLMRESLSPEIRALVENAR